ncbi:hypothetical protein PRZ48_006836 [Zasmidium cellare]|uniref:BTB domain-containing protein n=1 Tax=Zasmidium cellare TaxID=395010 RepID=A0ABR0EIP0_ZASCE|nr:hypothetical protein PRZ48_006836 [Zasmidium cellare]
MATTEPPAKRRKLNFSDEYKVAVGVGATQKTYSVPKQILTKSSEFFQKACNGKWRETRSKMIKLPEADTITFETYLQLLYTGEVVTTDDAPPQVPDDVTEDEASRASRFRFYAAIIDVYLLADMLLDSRSKNKVMDYLIDTTSVVPQFPGMAIIDLAYSRTLPSSKLRRLLVDRAVFIAEANVGYWTDNLTKVPSQFPIDLSMAFMKLAAGRRRPFNPKHLPRCTYHDHDDANPKCE